MANNPYPNKIEYFGVVKLDLSNDSVSASSLLSGETAHDASGKPISGTVVINKYYAGTSAPSASLGNDGDIYIQL